MIWGPSWACDIKGKPLPRSPGFGEDEYNGLASLTSNVSDLAIIEENDDDNDVSGGEKLEFPTRPYDEIEVLKYNSSYRTMFIERPRIRYNGVYISTCTYLRSGHMAINSLALSNPVHLVTYYRYLEPSEVVHVITLENYKHLASSTSTHTSNAITSALPNNIKHMLPGRWHAVFNPVTYPSPNSTEEPGGRIRVEAEGAGVNNRYINILDLTLKMRPKGVGGRRGYGDRLAWNSYISWNRLTDDRAAYTLKNDKPFYFSRIKAFEKDSESEALSL
ncbi:hypothetical protein AA313_de0201824 [Arthrobotrys entomopaga]|nr:hypothetical protein AA313_de0201824 [Arthrobotrys entomopaga]